MHPVELIRVNGGVLPISRLRETGAGRSGLSRLVAQRQLLRPRRGWYSTLPETHPRFRAVRIGGRLTGASALFDMGAWMLQPPRLEVAVARGSSRLRPEPGARVHWELPDHAGDSARVSLTEALFRVILDHDLEIAVPCLDWALHTGRLDRVDFERLILQLPRSAQCVRAWVDHRSESVLESVARVRLVRRGFRVASQLKVGDIRAIDLVVGDHVALELDGRRHHESSFERDRAAIVAARRDRGTERNSVVPPLEPHGNRHSPHSQRVFD